MYPNFGITLPDQEVTKDVVYEATGYTLLDTTVASIELTVTVDGNSNSYTVPFDFVDKSKIIEEFYASLVQ